MSSPNIPQTKTCTKCGETFPATTEFWHRKKGYKDGLRTECKECHNEASRRYHEAHPEKILEYKRRYRENHREELREANRIHCEVHRGKRLETLRRYRETHPESDRRYYEANREKLLEANHRRYKANREKFRVYSSNRRARKRRAEGSYTAEELQAQFKRQKGKCFWCGCKLPKKGFHADHVVPLIHGGSNYISNIVCACSVCNLSKHDKLPHEWNGTDKLL
jgi:5-methylcytosine-specific restriction endonuclease McrA